MFIDPGNMYIVHPGSRLGTGRSRESLFVQSDDVSLEYEGQADEQTWLKEKNC